MSKKPKCNTVAKVRGNFFLIVFCSMTLIKTKFRCNLNVFNFGYQRNKIFFSYITFPCILCPYDRLLVIGFWNVENTSCRLQNKYTLCKRHVDAIILLDNKNKCRKSYLKLRKWPLTSRRKKQTSLFESLYCICLDKR